MYDLSIMDVLNTQTDLGKPAQNLLLGKVLTFFLRFLNSGGQIAAVCIFHHDVQFHFGSPIHLLEFDDIWMVQQLQDLSLLACSLLLLTRKFCNIDLFDDKHLSSLDLFDQISLPKRARA